MTLSYQMSMLFRVTLQFRSQYLTSFHHWRPVPGLRPHKASPHTKKSGRFNATDTVTAVPELRWPNEGFHGIGGRKRTLYDDLSIQERAVGQLSNIYQLLVKQVLLQVILSLRDATSLPWQAVRSAWGNSMHEIEQGLLQWADATQWALNRLSTS